mgnify:CR=1 FL=1
MAGLSIDERVTIQLAVQRYVRAMVCSTTMWAFGPVFDDCQEVDCFQKWWDEYYSESIRAASEATLKVRFNLFRRLVVECSGCRECTVKPGGMCDDCVEMRREPAL